MKSPANYEYTIPSCLKPGYYLVRHEIIALHSAWQYPGAQFYPGCHQIQVTGGGSSVPSSLVSFPGAYKGSDPGITYDAYKGKWFSVFAHDWTFILHGMLTFVCVYSPDLYHPGTQGLHLLKSLRRRLTKFFVVENFKSELDQSE